MARGHEPIPSSSLVPQGDPSLLFVNAGMVQFKRTFLGQDLRPYLRATTCQKCVRAGGKHNDLEQVGLTARHHTFFEMLGNFSFGDYFKRDAIRYAWEFVTGESGLGISPDRIQVTVHHSDDEARGFWLETTGFSGNRVHGLGDRDNFWQMGDTGPCGPCSEIYIDLDWRPGMPAAELSTEEFEVAAESGRFLEIWNLVFMQFDRSSDGVLTPLPKPSVDTGAGLERIAAILQGEKDNFHTDLFLPLIRDVEQLVGAVYPGGPQGPGISYRVLADHARTVSFLLADGVYPSNEGRGFVLRRILRRAVRHAWLLGRREPTLSLLVPRVVELMGEAYPVLERKLEVIKATVEQEEERFLATIESGLERLEELFATGVNPIPGEEAFKLFDTFGFPVDLTELIAADRGIAVDVDGFEIAMHEQRERSRTAQKVSSGRSQAEGAVLIHASPGGKSEFVGYHTLETETLPLTDADAAEQGVLVLTASPFYATSGGQVADRGIVQGNGWRFLVNDVHKDAELGQRLLGTLEGEYAPGPVYASVDQVRRREIERNHSATHLAHLVLRRRLGDQVRQQGSLVEPGRLRFDFSWGHPIEVGQLTEIEAEVNQLILANAPTDIRERSLEDALELGAMAFFADKYGATVRVVTMGDSIELCGGTHVRSTGQIGLFRFTAQAGVAAGVRRIEAITGTAAYQSVLALEDRLEAVAALLHAAPDQIERRILSLQSERDKLDEKVKATLAAGGAMESIRHDLGMATLVVEQTVLEDRSELGKLADRFRSEEKGNALLLLHNPAAKASISGSATDGLIEQGKNANALIKFLASRFAGRGGGRPTFASGSLGVEDVGAIANTALVEAVREWLQQ